MYGSKALFRGGGYFKVSYVVCVSRGLSNLVCLGVNFLALCTHAL